MVKMALCEERVRYNAFKLAFRRAHPHFAKRRGNKYYIYVRAAYKAQGSTLDRWFKPRARAASPTDHFVMQCRQHEYGPIDVWYDCAQCLQESQDWARTNGFEYCVSPYIQREGTDNGRWVTENQDRWQPVAEEGNFYDTYDEEFPGELHIELAEHKRLLELYTQRLQYLLARDDRLELVRAGQTDLYEQYEEHFNKKIRELRANIAAIERRVGE